MPQSDIPTPRKDAPQSAKKVVPWWQASMVSYLPACSAWVRQHLTEQDQERLEHALIEESSVIIVDANDDLPVRMIEIFSLRVRFFDLRDLDIDDLERIIVIDIERTDHEDDPPQPPSDKRDWSALRNVIIGGAIAAVVREVAKWLLRRRREELLELRIQRLEAFHELQRLEQSREQAQRVHETTTQRVFLSHCEDDEPRDQSDRTTSQSEYPIWKTPWLLLRSVMLTLEIVITQWPDGVKHSNNARKPWWHSDIANDLRGNGLPLFTIFDEQWNDPKSWWLSSRPALIQDRRRMISVLTEEACAVSNADLFVLLLTNKRGSDASSLQDSHFDEGSEIDMPYRKAVRKKLPRSATIEYASTAREVSADSRATTTVIRRSVDVRSIREKLGMTQEQFADSFGLSVASLRNWEQGTRVPERPIALYLRLIDRFPKQVMHEVKSLRTRDHAPEP